MKNINTKKFFDLIKNKNLFFLTILLIFWWSFLSNIKISSSDVFHDRDQDGLTDEEEYMYGTDINNSDSDEDGYQDGVEVESGYDPLKPAPGDKILFKNENEENIQLEPEEEKVNLTDEFFEKLQTEKSNEIELLSGYYADSEGFSANINEMEALSKTSLTSEELQKFINQAGEESGLLNEMELIPEDEIIILTEVTGNEKKVKKEEKKQIEKYLTQIFYVMSVNKPFAIEKQELLPQIGVNYINEITGAIQLGQLDQLLNLKEKAQKTYKECLKIETPYKLKDIHNKTLSIIKYLTEDIDEEKIIDQQDPMMMALYVGRLQAALIEGETLKDEIDEIINEYEIEIFNNGNLEGIF